MTRTKSKEGGGNIKVHQNWKEMHGRRGNSKSKHVKKKGEVGMQFVIRSLTTQQKKMGFFIDFLIKNGVGRWMRRFKKKR